MIDPHNPDNISFESTTSKEITPKLAMEQSKIVEWDNQSNQVLWMVTDKKNIGIVVHSEDSSVKLGATMKLNKLKLKPFVGGLTINSK